MGIWQLQAEYIATAKLLEKRIAELKKYIITTDDPESIQLKKRGEILYEELVDIRKIIAHLGHYLRETL